MTRDDVPYTVATVHNAAVVKYNDRYIMLFRSHRHNGRSIIGIAESNDGFSFKARSEPFIVPGGGGKFGEYDEKTDSYTNTFYSVTLEQIKERLGELEKAYYQS